MPKYPIDLGKSMSGPMGALPSSEEKFYPSVTLEWERTYNLPESGVITFRFKKDSETLNKRGQTVNLELVELVEVDADKDAKDAKEEEGTSERLDKEFKKAEKRAKRRGKKVADPVVEEDDEAEGMGY